MFGQAAQNDRLTTTPICARQSVVPGEQRSAYRRSLICLKLLSQPRMPCHDAASRLRLDALQSGSRQEWAALFEPDAELFDDGQPRSLESFTRDALGHEHFVSIDRVGNHSLELISHFHSDKWGEFRTYFKFQLSPSGRIRRLDIGQAD
jgi:hypothetical protein